MAYQEDDWEVDINLGPNVNRSIFQRKGVFSYEPDKELALACERYQYAAQNIYSDGEDDADSSVAGSSIISGQFSELSLLNLDNFMYEEPSLLAETVPLNNQNKFCGTVRKLRISHKEIQDHDDWNDDIELSSKDIQFNFKKNKVYEQHLDDFDENDSIGPSVSQRGNPTEPEAQSREPTTSSKDRYVEQGEDDFNELHFPDNMGLLSRKLNEKKASSYEQRTLIPTATTMTSGKTLSKTTVNKPSVFSKLKRETENDDFLEGLEIKEKAFKPSTPVSKLPIPQPQRSTSSTKGKLGTSPFISRLARPTQTRLGLGEQNAKKTPLSHLPQPRQPPVIRRSVSSNIQSTLHRDAELTTRRTNYTYRQPQPPKQFSLRNSPQLTSNPSLSRGTGSSLNEKKGANGYTLISKPKTRIPTNYCSQLDSIDNLNDLRPNRLTRPRINRKDFSRNEKLNVNHPWRKDIQSSRVKLIQPNEQNTTKEYGDMKYDDRTHSWKGNESGLIGFPEKPMTKKLPGLVLLTNKQRSPSKYTATMSDSMVFEPELQSWVSPSGNENNDLDGIEDLQEGLRPMSKRTLRHGQYGSKPVEFKLSIETKRQMMFEQEQHEQWIKQWPLSEEEPCFINSAKQKVPISKYFLFDRNF